MVAHEQFPMFRLATLLARQLSAPIATRIKEYARKHPRFGRVACMHTARLYRGAELRFKLWSLRLPQPRRLPPITDKDALDVGADILGEAVIFGLGSLIVIFEVNRQAIKQEVKVLNEQSQWLAVLMSLEELQRELSLQQEDMDRLLAALSAHAPPAASAQ